MRWLAHPQRGPTVRAAHPGAPVKAGSWHPSHPLFPRRSVLGSKQSSSLRSHFLLYMERGRQTRCGYSPCRKFCWTHLVIYSFSLYRSSAQNSNEAIFVVKKEFLVLLQIRIWKVWTSVDKWTRFGWSSLTVKQGLVPDSAQYVVWFGHRGRPKPLDMVHFVLIINR